MVVSVGDSVGDPVGDSGSGTKLDTPDQAGLAKQSTQDSIP